MNIETQAHTTRKPFLAAVNVIIRDSTGRLLLQQRARSGYEDGEYAFVAGHLEGNETVQQAAQREAREETGVVLDLESISIVHVMHRPRSDGYEMFDFFAVATNWSGRPTIREPNRSTELNWYLPEALPAGTSQRVAFAIGAISRRESFSEYGWADQGGPADAHRIIAPSTGNRPSGHSAEQAGALH